MKKVITTIVIVLAFTACKQENKKVESSSTYETESSREEVLKIETSSTTSEKGRYSIVTSGQTEFFNNSEIIKQPKKGEAYYGQDAEHTTTPFSYTNNNDGTITDNVTGLMWQKSYEVLSYEDALEKLKTFELGGYTDWRLPTVKEAYSLMNFSGTDVNGADMSVVPDGAIPFIDTDYFDYGANGQRIIDVQILSSTFYKGIALNSDEIIFGVNVADGRIKGYPTAMPDGSVAEYTIRFVRGNSDYGKNNFKDNLDNTISDLATDLMWDKSDSKKAMNWEEALAFAQEKNKENYLGYSDWRVPNAKELQSIVDYNRSL